MPEISCGGTQVFAKSAWRAVVGGNVIGHSYDLDAERSQVLEIGALVVEAALAERLQSRIEKIRTIDAARVERAIQRREVAAAEVIGEIARRQPKAALGGFYRVRTERCASS